MEIRIQTRAPWMTREILEIRQKRDELYYKDKIRKSHQTLYEVFCNL